MLVTSDHGEEFQEHGDLDHFAGKVFEENVRVPLILRAPGVPAGRRIAAPASGLDVMPTLLAFAGAPERARALPGRNLLDLAVAGKEEAAGRGLLVQGLSTPTVPREARYRLDQGTHTLVYDAVRGRTAGYDRAADPGMTRPGPAPAALMARLQALLAEASGGRLAVRLPEGVAAVEVPAGSRIAPLGLWAGLAWRPATGPRLVADPRLPHCLVFGLRPGQRQPLPAPAAAGRPDRGRPRRPLAGRPGQRAGGAATAARGIPHRRRPAARPSPADARGGGGAAGPGVPAVSETGRLLPGSGPIAMTIAMRRRPPLLPTRAFFLAGAVALAGVFALACGGDGRTPLVALLAARARPADA